METEEDSTKIDTKREEDKMEQKTDETEKEVSSTEVKGTAKGDATTEDKSNQEQPQETFTSIQDDAKLVEAAKDDVKDIDSSTPKEDTHTQNYKKEDISNVVENVNSVDSRGDKDVNIVTDQKDDRKEESISIVMRFTGEDNLQDSGSEQNPKSNSEKDEDEKSLITSISSDLSRNNSEVKVGANISGVNELLIGDSSSESSGKSISEKDVVEKSSAASSCSESSGPDSVSKVTSISDDVTSIGISEDSNLVTCAESKNQSVDEPMDTETTTSDKNEEETNKNQEEPSSSDIGDDKSKDSLQNDEKVEEVSSEDATEKGTEKKEEEKSDVKETEGDEEGHEEPVFTADKLFDYQWPQERGGELYLLQEQVSEYIGTLSFKRKFPDMERRFLDVNERIYLMEKGIVTEMQCDMGLWALKVEDVQDLLLKHYPEKYKEYADVLHAREKQKITDKHKDYSMQTIDKDKMEMFMKKAVKSAADFNAQFNRERKEERRAYFDLQTMEVHYPKGKQKRLPPEATKVGAYPVSLIPGQFQDYYRKYTKQQLKYFPLNTAMYDPPKALQTIYADPAESVTTDTTSTARSRVKQGDADRKPEDTTSTCSSSSSSSSSDSDSSSGSSSSSADEEDGTTVEQQPEDPDSRAASAVATATIVTVGTGPMLAPRSEGKRKNKAAVSLCYICQSGADRNKIGEREELVKCSECQRFGHPSCFELTEEMIPIIQTYNWQCMECKTCFKCMDPYDEDKMMFCDHCDRGYHTFCVGLKLIPNGRWECPTCCSKEEPKAKKAKLK